jgi:hypothetical protein
MPARLTLTFEAACFRLLNTRFCVAQGVQSRDSGHEAVESLRVPTEPMSEADAIPVISYQALSYDVFDEQAKDAVV